MQRNSSAERAAMATRRSPQPIELAPTLDLWPSYSTESCKLDCWIRGSIPSMAVQHETTPDDDGTLESRHRPHPGRSMIDCLTVTIKLCTIPTCLAPSSVQQKFQFLRPIGIARSARSRWFVSIGTSGSLKNTSSPSRPLPHVVEGLRERIARQQSLPLELAGHPLEEAIDDRLAVGQPMQSFALPGELAIADLFLDPVERLDLLQRLLHPVRLDGLCLEKSTAAVRRALSR